MTTARKEKLPVREQVRRDTFTLRIPERINQKIRKASTEAGISQNDYILFMVQLGMLTYQDFIPHQKEELLRFLSRNHK